MENRVEFGLSNVHIAFESGEGTWSTPKPIPGAVSFTPTPQLEDFHFYADDGDFYNESSDHGYKGDLTIAKLPDWFLGQALGFKKDQNGGLYEIKGAPKKRFCLMFEGSGDKHKNRFCFINCGAGKPTEEYKTIGDKKEVKVNKLPIIISGDLKTGLMKVKIKQEHKDYATFFTKAPAFETGSLKEITE